MKRIICVIILVFPILLSAQEGIKLKIEQLNKMAWDTSLANPNEAIKLSTNALHLADSIDYLDGKKIAYNHLGTFYSDILDYLKAEEFLNKALVLAIADNNYLDIAKVYSRFCRIKKEEGDYLGGIEYGIKAMETLTLDGKEEEVPFILLNLAIVYQFNNDTLDALKYYDLTLEAAQNIQDTTNLLFAHYNKAFFYYEIDQLDNAEFHLNEALPTAIKQKNIYLEAAIYDVFGVVNTKQEKFSDALEMFNKSVALNEIINDSLRLFHNYIDISSLFSAKGEHGRALDFCNKSQKLIIFCDRIEERKLLNSRYSEVYEALGHNTKSYEFYKLAESQEDSIFNEKKSESIQLLKRKHAERNTALAEKQKATVEAKNYQLLVFLAIVSIFAFLGFVLLNQRRRAKARELVNYKKDQEKRINLRIIDGTKKTRKDLSHKLHNHVSTPLTHIKRLLEPIYKQLSFDQNYSDDIFHAIQIADNTHVVSRDISYELRPEKIDWVDNIKLSLAGLKTITSDFKVSNLKEEDFSKEKGIKISAVICNIISNIEKHSKADNVKIIIKKSDAELKINIKDNGIGFDAKQTKGVGLESIYTDVAILNGGIDIESIKGKGTVVNVIIPT